MTDIADLGPQVHALVLAATRPLRARVMALESQLVWQDQQMTDALAVRITDILAHLDAVEVGDLSKEELSAAFEATARKWNGKTNGANGAHVQ